MLDLIFRFLRSIKPAPLGRWCLSDKTKNNWKIDMANTDHCGTCSYVVQKPLPKTSELHLTPTQKEAKDIKG